MKLRFCAFLALLLVPHFCLAQPMADRVPSDAVIYFGWQGGDSLGTAYDQSHLKGVIDSSTIPQFFSEFLPRVIEQLGKEDAQAAAVFRSVHGIGRVFWPKPCAIYFGGIDMNAPAPMPRLTLIADGGADAQKMLESINPLVESLNRAGVPLVASVHAKRFVTISVGADIAGPFAGLLGDGADKTVPPLNARPEFTDTLRQVQKNPTVALYIDADAALKLIDQIAAGEGAGVQQHIANVRDAMGLAGIKRIAAAAGFDGADWGTQCFVAAPAPRNGLLAMLDNKPLSEATLKLIPKTSNYAAAGRLDVAKAFNAIRALIGDLDPDTQKMLDQGLGAAGAMTAVNLQTQLFEPLGDEWAFFTDPNVGGNSIMGFVLVNHLDDAKTVETALDKLGLAIGNIITAQAQGDGITIAMRQTKVADVNVRYWGLPFFSPSWTIKDGNLYIALQPQLVASAAAGAGKAGSILDNPTFTATRKRLAVENAANVSYIDLRETVTSSYATTLAMARLGLGFADMFGMQAPPMVLPPLHKLREQLGPASSATWTDDAGWHMKSITPFPGSELFATEANLLMAQQALALSVMLPAMNRGREAANRVKCASNMRQMGQGVLLYANDHKGKYPQNVGELAQTDILQQWEIYVCPDAGIAPPPPDVQKDPKKFSPWINQNATYVYLGATMNNTNPADQVLMYEKPGNHPGRQGLNVLYNDGHVEWVMMPNLIPQLKTQGAPLPEGFNQ
jgi:prepilin-type processing-associated H-X9-DG protein